MSSDDGISYTHLKLTYKEWHSLYSNSVRCNSDTSHTGIEQDVMVTFLTPK